MGDLTWTELAKCAAIGVVCAVLLFAAIKLAPERGRPIDCIMIGGVWSQGGC